MEETLNAKALGQTSQKKNTVATSSPNRGSPVRFNLETMNFNSNFTAS